MLLAALPREASHPQQADWPAPPPCCRDAAGHAPILAGGHACRSSLQAGGLSLLRMRGGGKPKDTKTRGGAPKDFSKSGREAAGREVDPSGGTGKIRSRRAFPTGHKSVLRHAQDDDDNDSDEPPKAAPKRRSKLSGLKGILQAKIKGETPPPLPPMRKKRVPRDASTMPDVEEGAAGDEGEEEEGAAGVVCGAGTVG